MTDITDSSRGDATEPFPQREFDIEKPERPQGDASEDKRAPAFDVVVGLSRHAIPPLLLLVVAMHLDSTVLRIVGLAWLGFWALVAVALVVVRVVLAVAEPIARREEAEVYESAMRVYGQAVEAHRAENAVMAWLTGHAGELPDGMDDATCRLDVTGIGRLPLSVGAGEGRAGGDDGTSPRSVVMTARIALGGDGDDRGTGDGWDMGGWDPMSEYLSQSATAIAEEALSMPYGTFLRIGENGPVALGVLAASEDEGICDEETLLRLLRRVRD